MKTTINPPQKRNPSDPRNHRFNFLSLQDLLDARDAYHIHLENLDNVLATAIGRFRIRVTDKDAHGESAPPPKKYGSYKPRTLTNSVVRAWSWPCVLVFVKCWLKPEEYAKNPDQAVPRLLYLPDGRIVPTCVILTEERAVPAALPLKFPEQLLGGGCPIVSSTQGSQRRGTAGCLVSDGRLSYLLTSRHIAAGEGSEVFAYDNKLLRRVGVSVANAKGRIGWADVYPALNPAHATLNFDVGLVQLDRVNEWTSQIFGLGQIGDPVDLHSNALTLDLVGCPVKACGGASGKLDGEIHALFYRYRTLGGMDDVTDFLIGPASSKQSLETRGGDSGTVWFVEPDEIERRLARKSPSANRQLRPIAIQWGGHRLGGENSVEYQFALASNLSAACRALGVEVVRDWNTGYQLFWGQVGHYKIGHASCSLLSSAKLKKLFGPNAHLIGIGDSKMLDMSQKEFKELSEQTFVPLADVPDEIWRATPARRADNSNHFADLDQPNPAGKTLLEISKKPENISVKVWNDFYESIKEKQRGAVPFRVWQIYDEMVEFVRQKKITEYFCAAGVLAHYIGDCGQPLHISHLHHGSNESEADVHGVYETQMLNRFREDYFKRLNQALSGKKASPNVKGGHEAAVSVVSLMRSTIKTLRPEEVIEVFNSRTGKERIPRMWEVLGERTIQCTARACQHLAMLWESAWSEGGGGKITTSSITAPTEAALAQLYRNPNFIKSYTLLQLEKQNVLKGGPPP